ncbi:MAG: extracellular solute-binding protein [Leptolyngbyaceae cyanobacterium bins.349]|nr:extracellular solute-binding protein [Leptolyngbyaceae cyanobacterium bins.349]
MLEEKAFSRWLAWLKTARQISNVYVDNRRDVLFDLFVTGKVAYFPCWTFEIPTLQQKLGDRLNVAILPSDLHVASPPLKTDSLIVNTYATTAQKRLAIDFAKFVTRREQQLAFQSAKDAIVIPGNPNTLVDRRLFPIKRRLVEQSQYSFLIPIAQAKYQTSRLVHYAEPIYTQVMQGEMSPTEGAQQFIHQINQPVNNEVIKKSTSVPNEVEIILLQGNIVQLQDNITPKADYLSQFVQIQFQILHRPIIWLQIILCTVVGVSIWWIARRLNRLVSNFMQQFNK